MYERCRDREAERQRGREAERQRSVAGLLTAQYSHHLGQSTADIGANTTITITFTADTGAVGVAGGEDGRQSRSARLGLCLPLLSRLILAVDTIHRFPVLTRFPVVPAHVHEAEEQTVVSGCFATG
jgi:hypothetical protein